MKTYISALIILGIVLVAHISGLDGLYYQVESYDIFMHILGGVGIALFGVGLLRSYRAGRYFSRKNILLFVLAIGVVWELFEVYYQLTGHPLWSTLYYIDTAKDMVDDMLGGGIVAWIMGRKEHDAGHIA